MNWDNYPVGTIVVREDEDGAEIVCEIAVDDDGGHYLQPLETVYEDEGE